MYEDSPTPKFTVSEFLALTNQTLDYALPFVEVEGEVSSFKVSKGKWVFFDLKDADSTLSCFMTVYNLRQPIEDGMKIVVSGAPKVTNFGKFSFTVSNLKPIGKGSIKKSFDLLKEKLEKEGLFAPEKKRKIPKNPAKIGVISSVTAAGYKDFLKILDARWGGIEILVANTGVQGLKAANEIIRALQFLNEQSDLDAIVIIRGGGSKDDLALFNDELLVREIARSKTPVLTGIGHEVDTSLSDLAADIRASTPSNAAELLTSDRAAELKNLKNLLSRLNFFLSEKIDASLSANQKSLEKIKDLLLEKIDSTLSLVEKEKRTLSALNPEAVLKRGYSILSGKISPGALVEIITKENLIKAEIKNVKPRTPLS